MQNLLEVPGNHYGTKIYIINIIHNKEIQSNKRRATSNPFTISSAERPKKETRV